MSISQPAPAEHTFAFYVLLMTICFVQLIAVCVKITKGNVRQRVQEVPTSLKNVWGKCVSLFMEPDWSKEADAFHRQQRGKYCSYFCQALWIIDHFRILEILLTWFFGYERRASTVFDIALAVRIAANTLLAWRPPDYTNERVVIFFSGLHWLGAIARVPTHSLHLWGLEASSTAFGRCLIGFIDGNFARVASWNFVYCGVVLLTHMFQPSDCPCLPDFERVAGTELWLTVYILAFYVAFGRLRVAEVNATVEARRQKENCSTSADLLDSMSDAVVHLDGELTVVEGATRLAGLLLRASAASIEGASFVSLVPASGKELLVKKFAEASGPSAPLATAFHTTLVDSMGTFLQVELFLVRRPNPSQRSARYIVGLREFSDATGSRWTDPCRSAENNLQVRSGFDTTSSLLNGVTTDEFVDANHGVVDPEGRRQDKWRMIGRSY